MKYKLISICFDTKCNMQPKCNGCYAQQKKFKKKLPYSFFYNLPKHLSKITEQVAIMGFEPLLSPNFIKTFSAECNKYKLTCNLTTNGKEIKNFSNQQLKSIFKYITMASVSFDSNKILTFNDSKQYRKNIQRLKKLGIKTGANVLLNKNLLDHIEFAINWLYEAGINNIYLLHPKPIISLNILPYMKELKALTKQHKTLYVDDCILQIEKYGYKNWKSPCHAGKEVFAINVDGSIAGCSFANPEFYIKKPEEILTKFKLKERMRCCQ